MEDETTRAVLCTKLDEDMVEEEEIWGDVDDDTKGGNVDDEAKGAVFCVSADRDGGKGETTEEPTGIEEAPRGIEVEEDCNGAADPADPDGDGPDGEETPVDVKGD